ncbi:MAG TPA: UDP-N-acetylmuramoyl-L-alanine--D-glutamate ligase [Acidimicrobiales bacterium]|nr:UDP-N-acetylmuramoyl-L-alanine--D-glutamate ligase [Acidimicrobiales bacterium]
MSRPTGFADLAGRRVGIFGYGVEGRASARRLEGVAASLVLVDDAPLESDVLATAGGGLDALFTCDVVLKSPGIPRRRADVLALEEAGVIVTSALNLWFAEAPLERVIAVTGTKGKSTTTSLVTFFLTCLGEDATSLGNIGRPPYDPDAEPAAGWLVVEVSSFQCVDLEVAPANVVVTSLGSDHLDWHGSLEQYWADKLSITRLEGAHRTFVADSARGGLDQIGGDVVLVEARNADDELARALGLLGRHNASNVALALAVVSHVTKRSRESVASAVALAAEDFVPLRGRLTLIDEEVNARGRIRYVDDGLATAPLPTVAALEVFAEDDVALLVGGFDRGVDYSPLVEALAARTRPTSVITMGLAGNRIAEEIAARGVDVDVVPAASMEEAVSVARARLARGGVVVLSPAAPSFDRYRNWLERSEDFAAHVRAREEWSLGRDSNP